MSIKVIGAGFGRTGTLSLKTALEEVGFDKCYHMVEAFKNHQHVKQWKRAAKGKQVDWDDVFAGYQSVVDFPGCLYYEELLAHYPDAKVVLTYRDPMSWYKSAYDTILTIRPRDDQIKKMLKNYLFSSKARNVFHMGLQNRSTIVKDLFQGRVDDQQFVVDVFNKHLEEVKSKVPAHQLLVYQVSEGWEPLCNFLEVPVPNKPFPQSNKRADFDTDLRDEFFTI